MTWSFYLLNGDLSINGPGGFAIVTGTQKLIQDLKNWLLEPQGTDPLHLDYGSTIDGGIINGAPVDSLVGQTLTDVVLMDIQAEIQRVLVAYQQQQLDRLYNEQSLYDGKNTFTSGELLYAINSISVTQNGDTAVASVSITTTDGQNLTFNQPVTG